MNTAKFSQSVRDVIGFSREEALRLGNDAIAPEHLLLGILREHDSNAYIQLSKLNIDLMRVKRTIESRISPYRFHFPHTRLTIDQIDRAGIENCFSWKLVRWKCVGIKVK